LILLRTLIASCVLVAGVAIGVACGTQPGTQTLKTLPVPADRACPGGQTEPVEVEELVRVFKRHQLEMFDDSECPNPASARHASNAPKFGPNPRRADAFDEVVRNQGYVGCDLLAYPENPLQPVKKK